MKDVFLSPSDLRRSALLLGVEINCEAFAGLPSENLRAVAPLLYLPNGLGNLGGLTFYNEKLELFVYVVEFILFYC